MATDSKTTIENKSVISNYISSCSGLSIVKEDQQTVHVKQSADGKVLALNTDVVEKVIERVDSKGNPFVQVNFLDNKKLLLTDTLVGFKPSNRSGLDMQKIPKVVTTPDLIGVLEALEDSAVAEQCIDEFETLRSLFFAVIEGAEDVGFDLKNERTWLQNVYRSNTKATA